jgi:rod shape determining protein RodA
MSRIGDFGSTELSLREKLLQLNWEMVALISLISVIGFAMLFSAANGNFSPWASRQMARFGVGIVFMLVIAVIDIKSWLKVSYGLYAISFALLATVEVMGSVGMGAQRWLDLSVIQLQPSETMKIALVMALARYFHGLEADDAGRLRYLILPLILITAPIALVLRQPDLGTAVVLGLIGVVMLWLAGTRVWQFMVFGGMTIAAVPISWQFLHGYQKQRVLTFLNPETDPLGAGYHIMQSKIALGSGGMFGKGFLSGTQSHLNFLPEKQTDFIFTMLAEEFGLVGGIGLIVLYALLMGYCVFIAFHCRSQFARLLAMGLVTNFFFYVFINIAMVMGLVPVVGVPLPLVSNGGTALLAVLISFGLVMSCWIHRATYINRRGAV